MIYLDYNATAPMRPEVKEAMQAAYDLPLNASSVHRLGRQAKRLLEDARETIATELSCFPNEIVFTGSGSEANNTVLRGFPDRPLLVSATEHSSIRETASRLGGDTIRVSQQGLLDLDQLESKLKALESPALVSVMAANNETGVKQPLRQIVELVHRYDGLFHVDAVQVIGKAPIDMGQIGADLMTISAHKMGGPIGVGALLVRSDLPIRSLVYGGNQELGRRAGTENLAGVIGFAKALELGKRSSWTAQMHALMEPLKARICEESPNTIIAGGDVERMPQVLCLLTPGLTSETQLMHLDLEGICVSAGSACSSGRIAPSHVLKAMGYSDAVAGSALRVSIGWNTHEAELTTFANTWLEMVHRLAKKAA